MEALNRKQTNIKTDRSSTGSTEKSTVSTAANDLLNESKKLATELYEEGLNKLSEAEQQLKGYSETVVNTIKEKPLTTLLIAGGIGYLLSKLFRK
jgi:hypothetical protein